MKVRALFAAALSGALALSALPAAGQVQELEAIAIGDDDGGVAGAPVGPDVIVGELDGIAKWGTSGGITSYSIATTSCNIGDLPLLWEAGNASHPVIAQNLYRLKNGRFEQIGMSWLKHGFFALSLDLCQTCSGTTDGTILGVGCSDPYDTFLNGEQSNLGPRSEVDAFRGIFSYPFGGPAWSGSIMRRLQVLNSDVDPAQNAGALFFGEGHYVTADDAEWNNQHNNVSHRRCVVGSFTGGGYNMSLISQTFRQEPAINAWAANDVGVTLVPFNLEAEGRLVLGYKVTEVTPGVWHYEYALYNMNSHRSIRSFAVPIPAGAVLSNIGFHDVNHHSGEPYSTTDWTASSGFGNNLTWQTQTYASNPNANALRWGTLYNFRFDCNRPPTTGAVTLGAFRPATQTTMTVAAAVPSAPDPCAGAALADADCSGTVDFFDIDPFLVAIFDNPGYLANANWCGDNCTVDVNADDTVDFFDIDPFLNCLFSGCP